MSTKRTKLIGARHSRKLSQRELAEELKVTRETINKWEAGTVDPQPAQVRLLCDYFGKEAGELDLSTVVPTNKLGNLWADDLLSIYSKGIEACQDLYFGGDPYHVEALLPLYTSQTAILAQQPSPLQIEAARIASLAQNLACELATDREDFWTAQQAGKQAYQYAELANDANLQVAALIQQANIGFHRKLSVAALQAYKHAVSLLDERVTPLLAGRVYAGLAEVHAMRGELQEAMRAMGQAYDVFPMKPESDPAYQYMRASRYSLYVFGDAQSRLFLGQPKEADQALVMMQKENNDPAIEPITKLDMLYYQAEIKIQQKELEASSAILSEAAILARQLGSRLYFNKLAADFEGLRRRWPHEKRVAQLEEVFQPW